MAAATAIGRSPCVAQPIPSSPGSFVSTFTTTTCSPPGWVRIVFTSVIFSGGRPRRAASCARTAASGKANEAVARPASPSTLRRGGSVRFMLGSLRKALLRPSSAEVDRHDFEVADGGHLQAQSATVLLERRLQALPQKLHPTNLGSLGQPHDDLLLTNRDQLAHRPL